MMEDFGHGIVDSRHVVLLVTVTVVGAAGGGVRGRPACAGRSPTDAPRARRVPRLAGADPGRGHRGDGQRRWRAATTCAATGRASRSTTLSPTDGRGAARAAPAGRGDDLPLPEARFGQGARSRGADARDHRPAARADPAVHARSRAGASMPSRSIPIATRSAPRPRCQDATASARTRWARASSSSRRATRSKVVTWEDLVEPELDADGEPAPALHAWRGEAAFVSALLTVTSDDPARICFSPGHGEPDIESLEDGGYATFAEELRRDGDASRALDTRRRRGLRPAAACWSIAEPTQAFSRGRARGAEGVRRRRRAAAGDAGAGVRPRRRGVRARRPGGRSPPRYGVRAGRQPGRRSVARQRRRGAVGLGGRADELPAAPADDALRRAADLLAAHARGRAAETPAARLSSSRTLVQTSPEGWGETDLPTIRGEADLAFDPARDRKGPVSVAVAVERARRDIRRGWCSSAPGGWS